ncbi:Gfo/Idh/MocA family oxidoreductase [Stieleria sp. TO1_6]|uniref:Gfo/Idh/MocA family protein n=1 Tax=Stieleria tagensis TaxID=2956795 RepID=UPI00209B291E|nr:Gfo/Idh/MocA family oxidoreductase [Stieleria tagensis]MCO8123933.1 Gfo/Idh/MocA family oxidoreductase [Stieleria tagensis]
MAIRWGLLGCGDIANKRVADAILADPNSELVAACRRDESRLKEFGRQFGITQLTTSAEELIARTDVDAIYVATPVNLHCQQTIAAANAGKHVLVEKPMALDPVECQQMIDACETAGVTLGVAYYRRFYPVVLRIAELISAGTLGRPLSVLATTGNPNRFPADDWRVIKSLGGGGPLMDIGSHRLDLFLQLFGEVKNVQACCADSPDYEAEDVATLLVQFANGCHGVLQSYFGTSETPDRLEVIGTEGYASTESLNEGELKIVTVQGARSESHPPHANFHAPLISDFSQAILSGRPPAVSGPTGKQTNDIIAAAYAI